MNTLMNVNPWRILDEMLDADSRVFRSMRARAAGRFPPVNVYLDDNAVIIDLELPGKSAANVDLSLEAQAMTVADKPEPPAEGAASEPATPAWSRRIELPFRVNAEKASAKFQDGILRIELPKMDAPSVRHIAIK